MADLLSLTPPTLFCLQDSKELKLPGENIRNVKPLD
jgi:hypothetical protein